ncbi:uncharacterized DUF497 family protein [Devosia sp. UYZn731]|uniref:BrnT family toxin n=1 Tax=Devosia sp. UYZn731 TaxID=3156345 RepID=UPI0033930D46
MVQLVYDEAKRLQNIAKHGYDFALLRPEFFLSAVVLGAHSGRRKAIGEVDGQVVITVVHAVLGTEAISIVSMRPASRKERATYARIA